MKLLRLDQKGQERVDAIDSEGNYRDLSTDYLDLSNEFLTNLGKLNSLDLEVYPIVDGFPRIRPCVAHVGKFICVGLNYLGHAAEANMLIPKEPILFFKTTSAICGTNDYLIIPQGSSKTDWEVQLGVVIGKEASFVSEADASDHAARYCIVNDLSQRAYQLEGGGQWVKGKSSDTFEPIGPRQVTKDEIPNLGDLSMWHDVDGHRFQDGSTQTVIFGFPHLISHISYLMSSQPGDVISTGTPLRLVIWQDPEVYLLPKQTMQLAIDELGQQKQKTVIPTYSSANALN